MNTQDQHPIFTNRAEAGRRLVAKLESYANRPDVLVLGLPRGGVPVAFEIGRALRTPLDVFVVRKLGLPGQEELAMGAIASGGVTVLNHEVVHAFGISNATIEEVSSRETEELLRREALYRGNKPPLEISGRTVILIDDGLATGSSMAAAIAALRKQKPAKIIVGVPVAAPSVCEELRAQADDIVCAATPEPFYAVGAWYQDFSQTTDREIHDLLERAASEQTGLPRRSPNLHLT